MLKYVWKTCLQIEVHKKQSMNFIHITTGIYKNVHHLTSLKKARPVVTPPRQKQDRDALCARRVEQEDSPWMAPCPTKGYLALVTHCARAIQNRSFIYSTIVPAGLQQVIFMRKLLVRFILLHYLSLYQWNDLKGMSYIFRKQKSKIRETLHFLCVYKWKFKFWILTHSLP